MHRRKGLCCERSRHRRMTPKEDYERVFGELGYGSKEWMICAGNRVILRMIAWYLIMSITENILSRIEVCMFCIGMYNKGW